MPSRQLVIFDFDETVLSAGSINQMLKFLPDYSRPPSFETGEISWIDYCKSILKELQSMGYSPQTLSKFICMIPPTPSMVKFIQHLCCCSEPKYDLIMISDCFRYFIINWLHKHKILDCFTGIYCNPSEITDCGELVVSAYHCVECPYSKRNLCKRRVMEDFVRLQRDLHINYDRVIYVGDGKNDFCPSLSMCPCDLMCARKGAWLEKIIEENRKKLKIRPEIFLWANGYELIAKVDQKKT
ncbi:pyridoxal phosphate phosphatase PHOSPHO2-like [Eurosta solidaginis]|uniref:pyridoxal phosphate phosphatase PHOSPHO2-like n=1 Tax=Eurosta solidaginis TaxID=178769 RepID=UPI003530971E